jgi:hypothetical protein
MDCASRELAIQLIFSACHIRATAAVLRSISSSPAALQVLGVCRVIGYHGRSLLGERKARQLEDWRAFLRAGYGTVQTQMS